MQRSQQPIFRDGIARTDPVGRRFALRKASVDAHGIAGLHPDTVRGLHDQVSGGLKQAAALGKRDAKVNTDTNADTKAGPDTAEE